MDIILNGETRRLDRQHSLDELLRQLGLQEQRLAIELNGEVIARSQHASTLLDEGDRVEIVHAIGGG